MTIKRLRVSNFKGFEKFDLKFDCFNIFVGANSSGKTNFFSIFKFLKDIKTEGLADAISLQGGVELIRNVKLGKTIPLKVYLEKQFNMKEDFNPGIGKIKLNNKEFLPSFDWMSYNFELKFVNGGYSVAKDELVYKINLIQKKKKSEEDNIYEIKILIEKKKGKISYKFLSLPKGFDKTEIVEAFSLNKIKSDDLKLRNKEDIDKLILEFPYSLMSSLFFFPLLFFIEPLIYDFNPMLSKKALPLVGKRSLETDGSNLILVLKEVFSNKKKKKKFISLLNLFLPHIEDVKTTSFVEKLLLLQLKEKGFSEGQYIPSFSISDGTLQILFIIYILYFNSAPTFNETLFIEEPGRTLHPGLISQLSQMFEDVSKEKQIFISTHNPELLKMTDINNLFLLSKNEKNFSIITKPSENKQVKKFLKEDLGIDELYIQELL